MKVVAILGVTVLLLILILLEYPTIDHTHKREKRTFATLLSLGWVLAVLLIVYPEMPGPTHLLNLLFEPLKKLL